MVDHRKIRQLLNTRLTALSGIPSADKRSWENREFTPPNPPETWIRGTYIPGTETLAGYEMIEFTGVMQYDVFTAANTGTETAEDLATSIGSQFEPGQGLTDGTTQVALQKCSRVQGSLSSLSGQAWYMIGVRVTFLAFASKVHP